MDLWLVVESAIFFPINSEEVWKQAGANNTGYSKE